MRATMGAVASAAEPLCREPTGGLPDGVHLYKLMVVSNQKRDLSILC